MVRLVDRPVERVLHRHNDALGLASRVRMENIAKRRARHGIDLRPKPLLRRLLMKRPRLTLDGNMHEISIAWGGDDRDYLSNVWYDIAPCVFSTSR